MDLNGARWRKSTFSGDNGGNCVEVAELRNAAGSRHKAGHLIAVRDSKNPDGGNLFFTPGEWTAFVAGVKNNEFDLP